MNQNNNEIFKPTERYTPLWLPARPYDGIEKVKPSNFRGPTINNIEYYKQSTPLSTFGYYRNATQTDMQKQMIHRYFQSYNDILDQNYKQMLLTQPNISPIMHVGRHLGYRY